VRFTRKPTEINYAKKCPPGKDRALANSRYKAASNLCTLKGGRTMARKSKKHSGEEAIVTESVRTLNVPQTTTDVVTEKKVITTEPEIEIRKPATLAQALTEPAVAVVKNKTRVTSTVQKRRVA
jgi:hypothetical protein